MSEFCRWRRNEGYEACADDMEGAAAHPVPARPDSKMPGWVVTDCFTASKIFK